MADQPGSVLTARQERTFLLMHDLSIEEVDYDQHADADQGSELY
jgi:hypothetical protein